MARNESIAAMESLRQILKAWWPFVGIALFVSGLSTGCKTTTPIEKTASFDPCQFVRESDPHCGWKPHWEHSGTKVNAIDGSKTEFLSMESTDADGIDVGSLHYAELRICFENGKLCGHGSVGVGVTVHGMVAPVGYDSEYSTAVRLKFDDGKPVRQTWGISDDHEALYPHGSEQQFLNQLILHNKLVLEFSYFEKVPRTLTFVLSGLADEMRSANLGNTPGKDAKAVALPLRGSVQVSPDSTRPNPTQAEIEQSGATADLAEAGPKPTTQIRSDGQCPKIETGDFVLTPSPAGHYWKFCSTEGSRVCFQKQTTDWCFK